MQSGSAYVSKLECEPCRVSYRSFLDQGSKEPAKMAGLMPAAKSRAWSCGSLQRGTSYVEAQAKASATPMKSGKALLEVTSKHIALHHYRNICISRLEKNA